MVTIGRVFVLGRIGSYGLVCHLGKVWLWLIHLLFEHYHVLPAAVLNTHTMISAILLYLLIVAGLAYAAYLKADINRWK